jgi:predicted DNA binding protein
MLTVTLEFHTADLVPLGIIPERIFVNYESIELLETLRLERGWRLQLLKLRRRRPLRSDAELERESRQIRREYGLQRFQVLERRPKTREYILLVRQRNSPAIERVLALAGGRISPTAPFKIDERRVVATFHGEALALRKVLARLEREGLRFRVVRSSTRPYTTEGADRDLTLRQRAALAKAWALGFYTVPRRITLTRLAALSGQSPPALGKMLRRAEGTLITRYLATDAGLLAEIEGAEPAQATSET